MVAASPAVAKRSVWKWTKKGGVQSVDKGSRVRWVWKNKRPDKLSYKKLGKVLKNCQRWPF